MSLVVIIPAKDEEDTIEKTLISLLNQTIKPDKIIIVLDRCKDNTEQIVDDFIKKNQIIEKVIKRKTKYEKTFMKGFLVAETVNHGIKKISTFPEFFMIANSDSIYSNNYIEEALKVFKNDLKIGLVGHAHYYSIAGSGYIFRSKLLEKYGGELKECAAEDTHMQLTTLDQGYTLKNLENVSVNLLRKRGEGNFIDKLKYFFAKGFAAYTLGYSFEFELGRTFYWILKGKLSGFSIIFGFSYAFLKREEKLDIAYTDVPKKLQQERKNSIFG